MEPVELEYESTTTLNRIRAARPCEEGWEKLLATLGKTKADDEPLPLLTVLNSNGLDDALWVLSYAMPDDRLARHFQAWVAQQVLHLFTAERPDDHRVVNQISMLRNDGATPAHRAAARATAWDAAGAATRATAWAAAGVAARATAWDAAWAATRATAGVAARATAWDAAWAATRATAWDAAGVAARAAQEKQLRFMLDQWKGQKDEHHRDATDHFPDHLQAVLADHLQRGEPCDCL